MPLTKPQMITVEEYFELERTSETKHQYFNGEVFAMTGASVRHNLLVSHVIGVLDNALGKNDSEVFPSDIKLELEFDKHYVYPDVSVVCGEIELAEGRNDTIKNPKIIFEVLSESTKDYDKGSKFTAYRKLPSMTDFVAINQDAVSVEHHRKQGPGRWVMQEYESLQDSLFFEELKISVSLEKIYHNMIFPKA